MMNQNLDLGGRLALVDPESLETEQRSMNRIEILSGGRFISHHLGAEVYHDSRHQVIKVNYSSGGFGELIKELEPDGSWRRQMLAIVGPGGSTLLHRVCEVRI
jgi:hypothetical protein